MCPTFELPDMDVTGSVFEGGEEAGYTHSSVGTKQILKEGFTFLEHVYGYAFTSSDKIFNDSSLE